MDYLEVLAEIEVIEELDELGNEIIGSVRKIVSAPPDSGAKFCFINPSFLLKRGK